MAGQRQATAALKANGKHHGSKAEYEEREKREIHASCDNIFPPGFLSKRQKNRFNQIVVELQSCDKSLFTNLDCEALARLIVIEDDFIKITKELKKLKPVIEITNDGNEKITVINDNYDRLQIIRQRLWNQCRQGASDFGLTISSRCKLVAPKQEEKPKNKFLSKFAAK